MGPTKRIALHWQHDLVFEGGATGGASLVIDAAGKAAPGPMDALLLALAACTGSDVVSLLEKMRFPVRALSVEVAGERRAEHPKRYVSVVITYRINAPGASEERARHAIELSLEKYCSVTHSLAPDIARRYELVLEA